MNNVSAVKQRFNSSSGEYGRTAINTEFEIRNIIVGSAGFMANVVAFCVVMTTSDVTSGRKILLLSLVISDLMCTAIYLVYGLEVSATRTSDQSGCVPVVFFLVLSILNSVTICLMLSIVSVAAVVIPFRFKTLVLWKYTAVGATMSFVVYGGLAYWWNGAGSSFAPGLTCAPIVVLPDISLLGSGLIMLLASFGVLALNSFIVIKLKSSLRFLRLSTQTHLQNQTKPKQSTTNIGGDVAKRANNTDHMMPIETTKDHAKSLQSPTHIKSGDNANQTFTSNATRISSIEVNDPNIRQESSEANANKSQQFEEPLASGTITSSTTNQKSTGLKSCGQSSQSSFVRPANPFARRDRICKALAILTTYSCLLSLPLSLYLLSISVDIIQDPEAMVGSVIGIFVSTCPVIKSAINPFFYAFQFVNWRNGIFNRCARACCIRRRN